MARRAYGRFSTRLRNARTQTTRIRRKNASTQTKRTGYTSGVGVTVQHDARQIYRKRRMPRRMKRKWKRFTRSVHAVAEKDLGSRTVVFNRAQTFSNVTNGNQGLGYLALYSGNGAGDTWMRDLSNISINDNSGTTDLRATGDFIYLSTKFIFKSAVLDITIRNTSTYTAVATPVLSSNAKLELDIYEILSGREWIDYDVTPTETAQAFSDLTAVFAQGAGETDNISGGAGLGTGLSILQRGTTPWDLPQALSRFRLKILKKTKYFIPNGDTITYQLRDPKRRVATKRMLEFIGGGNKPRWTRHVFIIFKLVPGFTIGEGVDTYQESISIGMTRKYFYKIEGQSEDRDIYISGT